MYVQAATEVKPINLSEIVRDYSFFERKHGSDRNRRSIEGKTVGCGKCVGYCKYEGHEGFLTAELRQEHNCINKRCHYYLQKPKREQESQTKSTANIVELVAPHMAEYQGVKIVRAEHGAEDVWNCFYVSITNAYEKSQMERKLCSVLSHAVKLTELHYDFDKCVELLMRA